jgi:glycerol-3-phosphate acyltransferase PlsX
LVRIALDAMGGDSAPRATVEGALLAARELDNSHIVQLVGEERTLRDEMERVLSRDSDGLRSAALRIEFVDAAEVITMSDKPASAVRGKPDSSMVVGVRLQKEGRSDAFVSAGNTGAQMAASILLLQLHPSITRPAIGTVFPTATQPMAVLDSGANVDCSAAELVQFARLGAVFADTVLGRPNPRVALLSIGEEAEKGNAVVKEAHRLLAVSGLNFVGNVEGRDLPLGRNEHGPIDVVVCDGFVGNIVLKMYEAITPMLLSRLAKGHGIDEEKLAAALKDFDYSEYGGAPLLGVRGVSIIAHGKSSARAIKNAVLAAARAADSGLSQRIASSLSPAGAAS